MTKALSWQQYVGNANTKKLMDIHDIIQDRVNKEAELFAIGYERKTMPITECPKMKLSESFIHAFAQEIKSFMNP
jgi:uncharacterized protein YfkK (UPF0435 family)